MKRILQLGSTFAAAIVLTFTACKKEDNTPLAQNTNNEDAAQRSVDPSITNVFRPGYVYTQTNGRENAVLVYVQLRDGSLQYRSAAKTGGRGTGTTLASQGSVTVDQNHMWLYAANAGDNTISAFRIGRDGNLSFAGMANSGGIMPVSLTTYKNFLYVVNTGSDNIQGFNTGADATAFNSRMIPIRGSTLKLSQSGAAAAQISFSPNGAYLYVTEKMTNLISSYYVDINGVAHQGYASQSLGKTPFGFAFAKDVMVVSNAANDAEGAGSATSFVGVNTGTLMPTGNPVFNQQTSSCWTSVARGGGFAYVTNTHSNTISAYQVGLYGRLKLLFPGIAGGMSPTEIAVDASNMHVYVFSTGDHTIRQYVRDATGFLSSMIPVDGVHGLPEAASGLATFSPGIFDASNTTK
jgi:6-phosphogluconolactonase